MNLKQPTVEILLNQIGPRELGHYLNTTTDDTHIVFKTKGIDFPLDSQEFSRTVGATRAHAFVAVTGLLPCEECEYEYGITLVRRVKNPGIDNSEYKPHQKYFGGVIPRLIEDAAAPGYMIAAQRTLIINSIITQINQDTGYPGTPEYANPGAVADAYYGFALTIADFANYFVTIGTTTITNQPRATLITQLNAIAGVNAIAHPTNDNMLYIYSSTAIVLTTGNVDTQRGVYLIERFDDVSMAVQSEPQYYVNHIIQNGQFSRLTYDDVFKVFAAQPRNQGYLANQTWANQPLQEDYVKIVFSYNHMLPGMVGASDIAFKKVFYNVYVPVSVINSAAVQFLSTDTMADDPATPDQTLEQFTDFDGAGGWATKIAALI